MISMTGKVEKIRVDQPKKEGEYPVLILTVAVPIRKSSIVADAYSVFQEPSKINFEPVQGEFDLEEPEKPIPV